MKINVAEIVEAGGKLVFHAVQPTGQAEKITWQGRDAYRFPVVAFQTGVWNRILYKAEVLNQNVQAWNGVPVPIKHPTGADGSPVSANSPEVWDDRVVGNFFDVNFNSSNKLVGNVYVFEDRTMEISPLSLALIMSNQTMELSTGMWEMLEAEQGVWEGKDYDYVCQALIPDHLALLPDEIGACSVADGCGTMRNNKKAEGEDKKKEEMVDNVKMLSDVEQGLRAALRDKYPDSYVYVTDVDIESKVVYYEVEPTEGDLVGKVTYNGCRYDDDEKLKTSTLVGEPFAVKKQTVYLPVTNRKEKEGDMKKEELIANLIANENTKFTDDDKEFLDGLTECQLEKLVPNVKEPEAEKKDDKEDLETRIQQAIETHAAKDQKAEKPMDATSIATLVANVMKEAFEQRDREPLIQALVANEDCTVSEKGLRALTTEDLRALVNKFDKRPDFSYLGMPVINSGAGGNGDAPEPMEATLLTTE